MGIGQVISLPNELSVEARSELPTRTMPTVAKTARNPKLKISIFFHKYLNKYPILANQAIIMSNMCYGVFI